MAEVPKISTKSSLYRAEENVNEVASEMYIARTYVWGKSLMKTSMRSTLCNTGESYNEIDSLKHRG